MRYDQSCTFGLISKYINFRNITMPNTSRLKLSICSAAGFFASSQAFAGQNVDALSMITKAYAPRIYMHPEEEWFPSSVSFFEALVH